MMRSIILLNLFWISFSYGQTVNFKYTDPNAKDVYLVSDLSDWKPDSRFKFIRSGNDFSFDMKIPDRAELHYKFLVDGKFILDPNNQKTVVDSSGISNSELSFSNDKPKLLKHLKQPVKLQRRGLWHGRWAIHSLIPSPSGPYDGLVIFNDGFEVDGKTQASLMQKNILNQYGKKVLFIFVKPEYRINDYDFNDKYHQIIVNDLIRQIINDKFFNHLYQFKNKFKKIYVGMSLGGLSTTHFGLTYPGFFDHIVSLSGSYFWNNNQIFNFIQNSTNSTKFHVRYGAYEKSDIMKSNIEFEMKAKNILNLDFKSSQGAHDWESWNFQLARVLEKILLATP